MEKRYGFFELIFDMVDFFFKRCKFMGCKGLYIDLNFLIIG